jgi:regulator of RNase E activity RraA
LRAIEHIERLALLYPAVVADCLDNVGIRSNVMAPHIRPLNRKAKLAGFAMTVQTVEVDGPPANRED